MVTLLLFLVACTGSEAPEAPAPEAPAAKAPTAEVPAPKKKSPWVGRWSKGEHAIAIATDGEVQLLQDGESVMQGPLTGKGRKRTAPLDGCGATLEMSAPGGPVAVDLDGPECPVEFIGTFEPAGD